MIKRLFCRHSYIFVNAFYSLYNGNTYIFNIYHCDKCNNVKVIKKLYKG